MLWIPITFAAATLQVARNALQRSLLAGAGPWGATLVRFLFGLPFSILFAAVAAFLTGSFHLTFGPWFWLSCAVGGIAQIVATAAMLVSMRQSSFALGTVFQQSSIPLAAFVGLFFSERLDAWAWVGLAMVTSGLMILAWPRRIAGLRDWSAALMGLIAGAGFAISANAARRSTVLLDSHDKVLAALVTVVVVQAMQASALVAYLALTDRRALWVAVSSGRSSLGAGFFGAAASGLWFTAFAMTPAGLVRAVGVVEMPIAALAGRRLFKERLALWQWAVSAFTAAGVALAALG